MGQVCSGTRLAFSAPDSSVNELPVMHNTKDFDDGVWIDPVEQQMARISDAMLSDDQVPRGPEMQRSDVLGVALQLIARMTLFVAVAALNLENRRPVVLRLAAILRMSRCSARLPKVCC